MDAIAVLQRIHEYGIIAIVRGTAVEDFDAMVEALREGGVKAIEVTLNTPGALDLIKRLADRNDPDLLVGAGTVLDGESARTAILAGASYVLAPTLNAGMIQMCNRYGVLPIPGVMTPTEALTATELGAPVVKIFPAGRLGPDYLKDVRGPLPQLKMIPVGGVTLDNAADFIRCGAWALGIGSELVDRKLVAAKDFAAIRERARRFVSCVTEARA